VARNRGNFIALQFAFFLSSFLAINVERSMVHTAFFHVHIVPHAWGPTGSLNAALTQK